MAQIASRSWMKLVVVFVLIGCCHGFLKEFCGISNEQARQRVMLCARQNLPDDIKATLEARMNQLGTTEIDAANRICEELSKDPNYKLSLEEGQRSEDIRSVERVMSSCVAEEVSN